MATAHQTRLYGNVLPSRMYDIRFATPGFPFIAVGPDFESQKPGVRYAGSLSFESMGGELADKTKFYDGVQATFNVDCAQTTMPELMNWYKLFRAPFQARFRNVNDHYYHFLAEAGTIAVPTSSQLVGGSWTFTHDDDRRKLNLSGGVYLTDPEFQWILDNSSSANVGGASGTTLGMTESTVTSANFKRSRFQQVTINGVVVGVLEQGGNSVTISTVSEAPDERGRAVNVKLSTTAEFTMRQSKIADQLAALTDRQTEYTVIASDLAGYTYKWTTAAASKDFMIVVDDSKSHVTLRLQGEYPIIAGQSAIDFGVGTATQIEFKQYAWA